MNHRQKRAGPPVPDGPIQVKGARWYRGPVALLCLAAALLPCAQAPADEGSLTIGAVYNLHGYQDTLDVPSWHGASLAVEEVNRNKGLLGRQVTLILVDGMSEPGTIARETAALLERDPAIPALMGLSDTDMVLAAAPVAAVMKRLFLTSGATSPRLPGQVPEYLFLACFGDNVQAAAAAESAWNDLGSRKAAILYAADNTYTDLLQRYFRERFAGLGGEIVSIRSYPANPPDPVIAGMAGADLVFLATSSPEESLAMIRQLRDAGVDAPIFGGDSYDAEQLWQQHPEIGDVYFTTHAYLGEGNPDPVVQQFRHAYAQAYNGQQPDAFSALGYDTARLLMTAIAEAGSVEPGTVRSALSSIREFNGVTGAMHYPAGSRIPLKSVTILRIDRGHLQLFRQFVPARVPPP
jgi:branched-chain amino acid transport system substrate-binding protein